MTTEDRRRGAARVTKVEAREQWVQAAVDAAVEQGFGASVEDPDVIAFIVDVFSRGDHGPTP